MSEREKTTFKKYEPSVKHNWVLCQLQMVQEAIWASLSILHLGHVINVIILNYRCASQHVTVRSHSLCLFLALLSLFSCTSKFSPSSTFVPRTRALRTAEQWE